MYNYIFERKWKGTVGVFWVSHIKGSFLGKVERRLIIANKSFMNIQQLPTPDVSPDRPQKRAQVKRACVTVFSL
jgi:predicted permease